MKETKETLLNIDHDEKTLTKRTKTNSYRPRKKKITIKTMYSTTTSQVILPKPVLSQQFSQLHLSQLHLPQ